MNLEVPVAFQRLWTTSKRYTVMMGGRGSGKSYGMVDFALAQASSRRHRILAARAFQVSLSESMHALFVERIHAHGMQSFWDIGEFKLRHKGTGSEVIYRGLNRNPGSLQSLQGITLCLVEEGQHVDEKAWRLLRPTIRRPGSRIVVALNPTLETDPLYRDLCKSDAFADVTERIPVGWRDNPWFTEALEQERRTDEMGDAETFNWVWGGELISHSNANVWTRGVHWDVDDAPDDMPEDAETLYGADVGMTASPSAMVRVRHWIKPNGARRIHVEAERYGKGLTLDAVGSWMDSVYGGGEMVMRSDQQQLAGRVGDWTIRHAVKGAGSVDRGVRFMLGCKTTIHPSCSNAIREFTSHRREVDPKTDEVLDRFKPGNDHAVDAVRYAVEGLMLRSRRRGKPSYAGFGVV